MHWVGFEPVEDEFPVTPAAVTNPCHIVTAACFRHEPYSRDRPSGIKLPRHTLRPRDAS